MKSLVYAWVVVVALVAVMLYAPHLVIDLWQSLPWSS